MISFLSVPELMSRPKAIFVHLPNFEISIHIALRNSRHSTLVDLQLCEHRTRLSDTFAPMAEEVAGSAQDSGDGQGEWSTMNEVTFAPSQPGAPARNTHATDAVPPP